MSDTQLVAGASLVGRTLAGRYAIRSLVGRGGMGEVYAAYDEVLERDVAVKILPSVASEDARAFARFRREARAAAVLSHPKCVAVHDLVAVDGYAFIVMELVPGRSLARLLDEASPLPVVVALGIARDVADALAYAHRRGVVHRDVAPGNVIVLDDGSAKVLDFGLAHAEGWTPALGGSPSPRGTIAYLSPEQVEGLHGDARSDVYSLGCLLYEMVTGRPPFQGPSQASIAAQHVRSLPVAPSLLRQQVPRDLEQVILRCLAKDPRHRFSCGADLAQALGDGGPAPSAATTSRIRRTLRTAAAVTERIPDRALRRPWTRWAVRLSAVVVAVALALVVLPTARSLLWAGRENAAFHLPRPVRPPADVVARGVCDGFLKSRVDISWAPTASARNGYDVFRSSTSNGSFRFVARVPADEASLADHRLGMGRSYYYLVRSVAGQRHSAVTEPVAAKTPLFCFG